MLLQFNSPLIHVHETFSREQRGVRCMKALKWQKNNKQAYVFLIPWMIGALSFFIIPMIYSLYISFTNYNISSMELIGFRNYIDMFTKDRRFINSCMVTLKYVLIAVPIRLLVSLGIAMLLKSDMKFLRVYRALYYIPSLLGGSVAISLLWSQVFGSKGIFNRLLEAMGLVGISNISWVSNPNTSVYTLIVLLIWQFGSSMIVFLAGIKQVPKELYEAAAIDGANGRKSFVRITLPMIMPIIQFNLIMEIINAFQAFTPAFIISNGKGGALDSMLFYTLYMYIKGFNQFQMGYSSAMAWVLLLTIAVVTVVVYAISNRYANFER